MIFILFMLQTTRAIEQGESYSKLDQVKTHKFLKKINQFCENKEGIDCWLQIKADCGVEKTKNCNDLLQLESQVITNHQIMKKMGIKSLPAIKENITKVKGLKFGSPNIDELSDESVLKLGPKDAASLRAKFTELKEVQKTLTEHELNLSCAQDTDCQYLPLGHKICGGPSDYLLVSKLDPNLSLIEKKLNQLTDKDLDLQKMIKNILGTCDYLTAPETKCENQVCVQKK